jgi:hypothetical protein
MSEELRRPDETREPRKPPVPGEVEAELRRAPRRREAQGQPPLAEEMRRLEEIRTRGMPWRKWGPYLAERQWGTVREDYSNSGDAWGYLSHDQARSRAYRWGEDGLGGISDDQQRLCFALALWNGADPILKERLFGLTNSEGNHGEDVKEYYFYLDSTPTHSYMKYLYKYPQSAYPYDEIVAANRARGRHDFEYELIDTSAFRDERYFDVLVEYAKASPEDILVQVTVANRGPQLATLHVLPTLWFRNTWSNGNANGAAKPQLRKSDGPRGVSVVAASQAELGERYLYCDEDAPLVFTENETNNQRIFGTPNATPWVKDGINDYLVHGRIEAVNPDHVGTKAAAHYTVSVGAGESTRLRLRLSPDAIGGAQARGPFADFDVLLEARRREADIFYASITPPGASSDEALVMRQALAGMLWSKQFFYYDLGSWLNEHGVDPYSTRNARVRNAQWAHMVNADVVSMPDKWEYPWYAAWDLAFHVVALNMVDPDFAKQQLSLVLDQHYLHPSGQIPAYEWNFGDVNPPIHAWSAWMIYNHEKIRCGEGDVAFLKDIFQKLLMNFTWWVNRKDRNGQNVFEGGFLGLDNIGVFDRSAALPTGGHLEQADGTAWMAFYSQCMLQMALELALHDRVYEDLAAKFYEHFLWIAGAMDRVGVHRDELWDAQDGFFYDLLVLPNGEAVRLKVRSMVGLLSLCASTVFSTDMVHRLPGFIARARAFTQRHPELVANISTPTHPGHSDRRLLSLLTDEKLVRVLRYVLDEQEFLSPFGIRSLSRHHRDHPYKFVVDGVEHRVDYAPAESTSGLFGGNSNWRGPIWFPVNVLLIRALLNLYAYYGPGFTVECPTGSGVQMNLFEVAREISRRLTAIFLRDENGRRPVYGGTEKFQSDPHWRDLILFYEYFHGDNGAGLGASHQTGWTGLVAPLIQLFSFLDAEVFLEDRDSLVYRARAASPSEH